MPDSDQSYDKENVNLWVNPKRKARWEAHLDEASEFQYLSQLIRHAVEREINRDDADGSALDLSQEVAGEFDDLHGSINEVEQLMQEVESRLSGLEREVRDDPRVRKLANEVFQILPTRSDITDYQKQETTGTTHDDRVVTEVDSGRIDAFAEHLDAEPHEVRAALDRLQEDTHRVHTLDGGDEPRYYEEAHPMDDWITRHLERVKAKKAESSYETHRSNLRDFDRWLSEQDTELTNLSTLKLEDYFVEQMDAGYAPNTISSRYESVRALFDKLAGRFRGAGRESVRGPGAQGFRPERHEKHSNGDIVYVTPDEKELLCENVPAPTLRNELIIRLMWQTSIRKVELINIELKDLHREERRIEVWSNKSKEWRSVFYQPSLDILLDQWLNGGHRDSYVPVESSPYLFVTERSEQLHESTVAEKVVKPAAEAAGIQEVMYEDQGWCKRYRITPHALRHGHAINALKSDIDVRRVQQHLGHSSIEITMEYLHFIDEDVKEAYDRFEG